MTSVSAVVFCASKNNDVFNLQRVRVLVRREVYSILSEMNANLSPQTRKLEFSVLHVSETIL